MLGADGLQGSWAEGGLRGSRRGAARVSMSPGSPRRTPGCKDSAPGQVQASEGQKRKGRVFLQSMHFAILYF